MTAKQEQFALSIVEGRTQSAAYREAYDAEGMQDTTVWTEASKLMRHPQVSQRVEELKEEAEATRRAVLVSREEAILQRLEHEAMTAKTDSARIRALELLGRHIGMFKDQIEVEHVERSAEQIEADILTRLERLGWLQDAGR
ncbi:MAG: hypothetical protein O9247_01195 [Rhodobacteraceae bacterium]|nr:hypothetical protein [Paracoccaceae bacterium]